MNMKTWMKWAVGVVAAAVLGVVGGPFVYINFIKDDPPKRFALDEAPSDAAAPVATSATRGVGVAPVDGTWLVRAGSEVGYRVVEILFGQDTEGVGRTGQIAGEVSIAGSAVTAGSFEVDMTTIVSDEDRRDRQFHGRIMDTAAFPTATFNLTAPIELGATPADGAAIVATASGQLTLHGVTRPVTFEVQGQKNGDAIQLVGSTDIVFADYQIPQPDAPGVTTRDHGLLEFDLHLTRA